MSDLERLDEAIERVEAAYMKQRIPDALSVIDLIGLVRQYRDLLANGVEPDYEAAGRVPINPTTLIHAHRAELVLGLDVVKAIVEAAIGDRLLTDPTTEEE